MTRFSRMMLDAQEYGAGLAAGAVAVVCAFTLLLSNGTF